MHSSIMQCTYIPHRPGKSPHKQGESLVSMSHNKEVQWFQSRHTVTASLKLATSQGDDVTARVEEEHCSVYIGGRVASLYKYI